MVTCKPAPAIAEEQKDWISLGGMNWGICGNRLHHSGFHLPAANIARDDYSLIHDSGVPVDMTWACAGDYAHVGKPELRGRHLAVLTRLMSGDPKLNMVCEFIGKPWADRPVYYWARWNGITTLKKYTGAGHDTWSHISLQRSKANLRPHLWIPGTTPEPPIPVPIPVPAYPKWPGQFIRYRAGWNYAHRYHGKNILAWQKQMAKRGWRISPDGDFAAECDRVLRKFQHEKHLLEDGILGPISWRAAWVAPVTKS